MPTPTTPSAQTTDVRLAGVTVSREPQLVLTDDEREAVLWALDIAVTKVRDDLDSGWYPALGKRNNALTAARRKISGDLA